MNNHLLYPVVEAGTNEEADPSTFGGVAPAPYLPELKNYAKDDGVVDWVRQELFPLMQQTRWDRAEMETGWEETRNMVQMKHDGGRRYFGRSDQYLPLYRKSRSTLISTLSRGLFPSDDYFDCVDRGIGDPEAGRKVKAYMQWEMETNARVRARMKTFLSQAVDYGTVPLKIWYRKEFRTEGGARRMIPGMGPEYGMRKCTYEGMAVSPRSLFYTYVYPMTAEDVLDAQMIFEDIDIPASYLDAMKRSGKWENVEEVARYWENSDHLRAVNSLMESRNAGRMGQDVGQAGRIHTITEVWCYMNLPESAYTDEEDSREPVATRLVLVDYIPLEVRRNPFFHQRPPYRFGRMGVEAGFFYGSGAGYTARPLQLLGNDFMNQTNDNGIMAMNPITLMNVGLMVGTPRPLAPGVVWGTTDVNEAVKFYHPPWEQVQVGVQMLNQIVAMENDVVGAPPALQGTSSKGAAKTATGQQLLTRQALGPLQDQVEDLEVDVLVPMLEMGFKNAVQYRDQEVMAIIAGERLEITPEDLAIDAHFRWLASTQTMNSQARAQQAMGFIQALMPLVPLLAQQGKVIDFEPLLKRAYTDGLGFRGFDQIIRPAQAMGGQMGPPSPEQMGGVQAEAQDRVRSALEQVHGREGAGDMLPGEGEEFMEVRGEADQMAGAMGGMSGSGGMGEMQ